MNSIIAGTNLCLWARIYGGHPYLATPDFRLIQQAVPECDEPLLWTARITPETGRPAPPNGKNGPASF